MFKRIVSAVLVLSFLLSASGCSGVLRRKFVRKKKEKQQLPVFQPKSYESEFTKEQRYINHFVFWKNAHTELIRLLGETSINNKKLKFFTSHSVNELNEMAKLLPDEKQQQIKPYIEQLADSTEKMDDSSYVSSHRHTLIKKLRHIYREVVKNFSYGKMKTCLQGQ